MPGTAASLASTDARQRAVFAFDHGSAQRPTVEVLRADPAVVEALAFAEQISGEPAGPRTGAGERQ